MPCPQCGPRDVYEFRYGGEAQRRPAPGSPRSTWTAYLYDRTNAAGVEDAWWYHRLGCKRWFRAVRDTRDNTVLKSTAPTVPPRDANDPPGD
ncbi:MAG: sarcosine oxidase subunit delta [SAR202 cluster bacterium]|nr:sarcosine oxidase subunit delta [SAR202 cluster bacterium]